MSSRGGPPAPGLFRTAGRRAGHRASYARSPLAAPGREKRTPRRCCEAVESVHRIRPLRAKQGHHGACLRFARGPGPAVRHGVPGHRTRSRSRARCFSSPWEVRLMSTPRAFMRRYQGHPRASRSPPSRFHHGMHVTRTESKSVGLLRGGDERRVPSAPPRPRRVHRPDEGNALLPLPGTKPGMGLPMQVQPARNTRDRAEDERNA